MATLLLSEIFPPKVGGSSRWFWEIYRRMPRQQFVIAAGKDPLQDEFDRTHDLRLRRLPLNFTDWGVFSIKGMLRYWRVLHDVEQIIRTDGIDRIHCGRLLPEGWIARMLKRRHRIPYICYVHGEEANTAGVGEPNGVLSSRQLRWMTRKVVDDADFVIANSQNTRRILMSQWDLPMRRVRLMYPGVDTEVFVPAVRDEAIRVQLGWKDRPVILTVGRLELRKGHEQMILALRAIRKAVPDVLYAIVGDGERREFLRALVEREGLGEHVQFLGELHDERLVRCYQQCDLFVLSNRQVGTDIEGFGMVLLEAQACGKPVVAGASGGTSEAMRNPETGRLVSCDGPHELEKVVVELLNDSDLRTRMGEAARQWVVRHFDWSSLSRQARILLEQSATDAGCLSQARAKL
jgi:phosphatidylinositol alpha-1,6-mannosyltransferase